MYPKEFSLQHQARIEAEKIRAANRLSNARNNISAVGYGSTEDQFRKFLRQYVLDVFSEFGEVACELGRQGIWSAVEVETEAWQFICAFAVQAEAEQGYDRNGQSVGLTYYNHKLISGQIHLIRESTEWKAFQTKRLDVATIQAAPPSRQAQRVKSIGEQLDEIVLSSHLSHEELAAEIGISRSAYFAVKGGEGGQKSKTKVSLYLSKRSASKKD